MKKSYKIYTNVLKMVANNFGKENQLKALQLKCAELEQEIDGYFNNKIDDDRLLEGINLTYALLWQTMYLFNKFNKLTKEFQENGEE